jgi:polar amino acid transport system substrate-binding protein
MTLGWSEPEMHRMALIFFLAFLPSSISRAGVLDDIAASKLLVVGVKDDYQPFGFRDGTGAIVGFEPDLAADAAKALGASLQLIPVTAANRIELLRRGLIDLIIATMTDTPERRQAIEIIEPFYYADYTNVLFRKDPPIYKWNELNGQMLCASKGTVHIQVAEKYGASLAAFEGADLPMASLARGECLGYIYDQSYIIGKLMDRRVRGQFEMPLPGIAERPWAVGVRKGDDRFKLAMQGIAANWVRSGLILELEQKWHVPSNSFAMRMHDAKK